MSQWPRRAVLVGAALVASGCLSPTLPLPPPVQPDVAGPDLDGNVELTGYVSPNAEVFAYNSSNASRLINGYITGDDGHYDFKLAAQKNDLVVFWYSVSNEDAPSIVFKIR
jgi:hypothetical protein